MNKLSAQYVAGIVDGEGTLGIRRYPGGKGSRIHYRPMIEIFNTHKELIDLLQNFFGAGGCVYDRIDKGRNKILYTVRVTGKNCLKILDFIEPYLIVKSEQAKILRKMINRVGNRGQRRTDAEWEKENFIRHELYAQIRLLNSGTIV